VIDFATVCRICCCSSGARCLVEDGRDCCIVAELQTCTACLHESGSSRADWCRVLLDLLRRRAAGEAN